MAPIFDRFFKAKTSAAPATTPPAAAVPYDALLAQAASAAASRNFQRAMQLYDQASAVDPLRAEGHYKCGNVLKDLGQLDAAIASYNQAIDRRSDYAYAYCNRGFIEHRLGRLDAALASYDRAIALDPADALVHYNRALLMQDLFRWKEALASFNRAIEINPEYSDAQYNRAVNLLYQGDFENGWRAYEWRWKNAQRLGIGEARNFSQPLWLGEQRLSGKRLLLHSEAGLGDTIQFCRYATLAAARDASVILEVQPPLLDLLASLEGVSEVIAKGGVLPPFDYHCPLVSLPLAFKTTIDTIPAPTRYLPSNAARIGEWRKLLGARAGPRIGLVWSGNPKNIIDQRRSIPLAEWVPHLPPQFQYFQLQTQVRAADQETLESTECIFSFDDDLLDFSNTAALCECMDLVISVDTSLAHLSGALGVKTWLLLAFTADWRWMRERADSPWYPSLKLYRQKSPEDWSEVFTRVAADLRREFPSG